MQKDITTSVDIKASPEKVWSVFTDFESYPSWNPFILKLTGAVAVGNQITAVLGGMIFKPEVLVYEKDKELKWLGNLFFKGLFDG